MSSTAKQVAWSDAEGVYLLMKIDDKNMPEVREACLRRIESLRRSLMIEAAWRAAATRKP